MRPTVRLLVAAAVVVNLTACVPGLPTLPGLPGAASVQRPPHAVGTKGIRAEADVSVKPGAQTVVLYHDFQCPGCKGMEADYAPILHQMAREGEIRYELHTLTFLDSSLGTEHSKRAAVAAACGDEVGKYADVVARLYQLQPAHEGEGWTDDQLTREVPQATGMDATQTSTFAACVTGQKYLEFVKQVDTNANKELVQAGEKVAVPKILVNGKLLRSELVKPGDPASIRDAIKATR